MNRQVSHPPDEDKPTTLNTIIIQPVHRCVPCNRYFLQVFTALNHFKQFHYASQPAKKKKVSIDSTDDVFAALTEVVNFPQISVNVEKLREAEIGRWKCKRKAEGNEEEEGERDENLEIRMDSMKASEIEKLLKNVYQQGPSTKENESKSSSHSDNNVSSAEEDEVTLENKDQQTKTLRKGRKRKNQEEVEIKLDSLKASEIDTLMKGLFQVQTPAKMPYNKPLEEHGDTNLGRRSARKAKERFKRDFGELDSSDEEIIKTGVKGGSRKRQRKKAQDPDFDLSKYSESTETDKTAKAGRGRPRRKSLSSNAGAVVTKYEIDEEADEEEGDKNDDNSRYFCRFCKLPYTYSVHYSEHMKERHGNPDGTYRCDICQKSYPTVKALNKHFNNVHGFPLEQSNSRKSNQEKTDTDFEDSETDVSGRTRTGRGSRFDPANPKPQHYCSSCDIQYNSGRPFTQHMMDEHIDEEGYIVCQVCKNMNTDKDPPAFRKMGRLLRHHYTHFDKNNGRLTVEKRPKGPFTCETCNKTILYYSLYIQHVQTHDPKIGSKRGRRNIVDPSKNFQCPVCFMRVSNITSFKRHFTTHLETNPFRCKFSSCNKTFGDYYHLTKHLLAVHTRSGELLKCKECPARYCNAYYYQRHYREAHRGVDCPIPFATPNPMALLPSELVENSGSKSYNPIPVYVLVQEMKSEIDKTGQENSSNLSQEKDSGNDETSIVSSGIQMIKEEVDIDGEAESSEVGAIHSEQALVALQNKALVEDPVVVRMEKENPDGFKLISALVRLAKNAPKECYKCHLCDWSGGSYLFYEKHMQNVHSETPRAPAGASASRQHNSDPSAFSLNCGRCGAQAKSIEELTEHMNKVHIGKWKFPCPKCGVRFPKKSSLEQHDFRVHGDGEKFPCTKCTVICSTQMSLHSHMKNKHGPQQTFECPTCGKTLQTRTGYLLHKKRHLGTTKKSKCEICGHSYATVHVLARHIALVHTRTLKLSQIRKSKKNTLKDVQAAAEAELKAAEEQEKPDKRNETSAPDAASLKLEETPQAKECQEIIGF